MPIKAVNHYRRTLLKGLGAATLLSPLASLPSFAAAQEADICRWFIFPSR